MAPHATGYSAILNVIYSIFKTSTYNFNHLLGDGVCSQSNFSSYGGQMFLSQILERVIHSSSVTADAKSR